MTVSASSSRPRPIPMMTPSRSTSESASRIGRRMSPLTSHPMLRTSVFMAGAECGATAEGSANWCRLRRAGSAAASPGRYRAVRGAWGALSRPPSTSNDGGALQTGLDVVDVHDHRGAGLGRVAGPPRRRRCVDAQRRSAGCRLRSAPGSAPATSASSSISACTMTACTGLRAASPRARWNSRYEDGPTGRGRPAPSAARGRPRDSSGRPRSRAGRPRRQPPAR